MNELLAIVSAATVLLGLGIWLMMPRGRHAGRALGTLLITVALGLVASQIPRVGEWASSIVFHILAAVTVLAAVATVTFRNPVYSAIWFAMSLTGTAGLFLFDGAQFLGVATIVVYAGAILVTFLFVLMLAQPRGQRPTIGPAGARAWPPRPARWWSASSRSASPACSRIPRLPSGRTPPRRRQRSTPRFSTSITWPCLAASYSAATCWRSKSPARCCWWPWWAPWPSWLRSKSRARAPGMNELALLQNYLVVGALLFGIGLVGFFSRRNMIVMFLSVEMMLQGVSVSLVAWGRYHNDWGGQMLVIFILTVAACEAAIALAVVLTLFHRAGSLDIAVWQNLREANQPAFADREAPPGPLETEPIWPHLTPAGIEPAHDFDDLTHRSHM